MVSRRDFIVDTAATLASMAVVASCRRPDPSTSSSTSLPTSSSPATTVAISSVPTTTVPTSSVPTTSGSGRGAWSGADFAELDDFLAAAHTEAFRIVEQGEVIHEWYRTDSSYGRDIASAQKSVLSLLVGRAIADGFFGLDTGVDEVLGTGWTPHGGSAGVTVRQLLSMTSGLDDRFAVIARPGTTWRYSGAFAALFDVLTTTTGRDLGAIADDWLFAPAGATSARFYERRTDRYGPVGLFADGERSHRDRPDRARPHTAGPPGRMARRVALDQPAVQRGVRVSLVVERPGELEHRLTPDAPSRFYFKAGDPEAIIRALAQQGLQQVAGIMELTAVLTTARSEIEQQLIAALQPKLDDLELGVRITAIRLQDVHPPTPVVPAFRAVAAAREDKATIIHKAEAYQNETLPQARGYAALLKDDAEAYVDEKRLHAQGDAAYFATLAAAHLHQPEAVARPKRLQDLLNAHVGLGAR